MTASVHTRLGHPQRAYSDSNPAAAHALTPTSAMANTTSTSTSTPSITSPPTHSPSPSEILPPNTSFSQIHHQHARPPSYHDATTSSLPPTQTSSHPPSYTASPSSAISQPQNHQLLIAQATSNPPIYTDSYCDDELPFINDNNDYDPAPPSYYSLFTRREEELMRLIREYDGFKGPTETAEAICKWLIMLLVCFIIATALWMSLR